MRQRWWDPARVRLRPLVRTVRDHTGLLLVRDADASQINRYLLRRLGEHNYRRVVARALRNDPTIRSIQFERDGMVWTSDMADVIAASLFGDGEFEGDAIRAVSARIGPGAVVDLGANVGTTTIPFARAGRRVLAVEPVPRTFEMLEANVAASGAGELVDCVQCAVTREDTTVEMVVSSALGESEIVRADRPPSADERERVIVKGRRLDDLVADFEAVGGIALVWADVQGSEDDVLLAGDTLWRAGVPAWIEISPYLMGADATREFVDIVGARFSGFIGEDELLANPATHVRPISKFGSFVAKIPKEKYTNVLLVNE